MKTKLLLVMALVILVSCKKAPPAPPTNPPVEEGGAETVSFSGYTWKVTSSGDETQSPGPNIFSRKMPGSIKTATCN